MQLPEPRRPQPWHVVKNQRGHYIPQWQELRAQPFQGPYQNATRPGQRRLFVGD